MRTFFHAFLLWAVSLVATAAELQVEIDPLPDWQKPIMSKVTFDVQIRTLNQILGKKTDAGRPTFLVFTAATTENLGKRLLWINGEVELSDGRKVAFKGICFHLLSDGVEADIQKLDGVDSIMPSDLSDDESSLAPLEIRKLRIRSATWK
jgi:hypothetical protein